MSEIELCETITERNITANDWPKSAGSVKSNTADNGGTFFHRSQSNMQAQVAVTSSAKTAAIIACITCTTGLSSFLFGTVIVALPRIISDLQLTPEVALWPVSISALTSGCTLLLCGSVSDVVGGRRMYLIGCLLQVICTLACGLSKTGAQLIVFRAIGGVTASFCLPSVVSLVNDTFPPGPKRNIAFSSMGGGQPIGFGLGITLGGIIADRLGWRWGFYISSMAAGLVWALSVWQMPRSSQPLSKQTWQRLKDEIDWVGVAIASTSLGMLSYVLAIVSGSLSSFKKPSTISIFATALALMPTFVFWVRRQEKIGQPALIPNSLWRNRAFSCICINVFLVTGSFDALAQVSNFYFQEVQSLDSLQAAIRLLPMPAAGVIVNIVVGMLVHRLRADWIVIGTSILTCCTPIFFAVMDPGWSYWAMAFIAVALVPVGYDGLYTISNLLITSVFPKETQGLAGGVFNTLSYIGTSVGLALLATVSNSVTVQSRFADKKSPEALLAGYRAASWLCLGMCGFSLGFSLWGLRRIGKVGKKED